MPLTVLDDVIPPLRPLAAQVLRHIAPYWLPTRLAAAFRSHMESSYNRLVLLTGKWEAREWAALAQAVSSNSRFLALAGADDLMQHTKFEVKLEGVAFQFYTSGGNQTPRMTAPAGSLEIHEAALLQHLQRITDDAARRRRAEENAAAIVKLFNEEQDRAAGAAGDATRWLEQCRAAFKAARRQAAAAEAASVSLRSELARLEQQGAVNRANAAQLSADGQARLQRLEYLQEERRKAIAAVKGGDAAPMQKTGTFDRLCDDTLDEIEKLAEQARRLQQEGTDLANAIASVEARHVAQSQASHQAAKATAAQTVRQLGKLRSELLGPPPTAAADWRRIEATLRNQAGNAGKLQAQLAALNLWHLDRSATHPQRRQLAQQASELVREIEAALGRWQQPSLRGAMR